MQIRVTEPFVAAPEASTNDTAMFIFESRCQKVRSWLEELVADAVLSATAPIRSNAGSEAYFSAMLNVNESTSVVAFMPRSEMPEENGAIAMNL